MRKTFFPFTAVVLAITLAGCTSLVYAPAVHLSEKPLAEKEVEVRGGIALLPETRPKNAGRKTSPGGSFDIGYGISNHVNLYLSGWANLNDNAFHHHGWALSSRIPLVQNARYELMIYPRAAILFGDGKINGYGGELPFIFLKHFTASPTGVYAYAGLGFAYGIRDFKKIIPQGGSFGLSPGDRILEYGYGVIGHIGLGWNITEKWRLTGEVNPISQTGYDNRTDFIIAPSVSVGYRM